ncbi:tryptase-2 [Octopus sinensis]|uniref:Tryptase-2 n=1 Tax=Octopus sinensis TaxID=2607531 RepID=A0A6P7T0Z7_9MOLL|nr:tryptase-2 [Octopus sinensis]
MASKANQLKNKYVTAVLVVLSCLPLVSSKISRIVNGESVPHCNFPWIVNLRILREHNYKDYTQMCGASLIARNKVITAAHCVRSDKNGKVFRIEVNLATDNPAKPVYTIQGLRYKYIKQYHLSRNGMPYYDIAIIELEHRVTYSKCLRPITLPQRNDVFTGNCWALGWGSNGYDQKPSASLKIVQLPIVSNSYCPWPGLIYEQMCAGVFEPWGVHKGICSGDSGGPLICVKNDRPVLAGLASFGNCGMYPGVFTKVSSFVDWIYKNIE